MKIRFINALILTMEEDRRIFHGEIHVENERITYVGPSQDFDTPFDRIINCDGNLLMPSFKNAHTHSAMTFLRSYADDLPLFEWLETAVFPLEDKLQPGDQYVLTKIAFAEYLTSGVTACFDMYYSPLETAKAAIDVGFRAVLVGTVTKYKESVKEMKAAFETINKMHPLVSYHLGFHAEYTSSPAILAELAKAAHELKVPIWSHISETKREVEECIERHGKTPAEYIASLGLYKYGGGGFHGVHFRDVDFEIYKKYDLHIVTNPSANTKLASGIAPIKRFLDEGINVAIGTDGPASNNALDFFREMFLVTGLAKLRESDASVVNAYEVLKMATVNGARALGLKDARYLTEGSLADIIMLDLMQPNMQPINNIEKNIVYSGSKVNVLLTMVHGKILYENGEFYLDEPIEEIYRKAQVITERLKN
ncbi:MAG TPA: amidohydrolase [Bacilli bacterium]|nr:amidohydrolase [Bacilli bacterium]